MKAVLIHEFGGPEQINVEEIPVPEIEPGEALVRVRAAAVNPVDWMVRERIFNPAGADDVPLVLGQDFAGTIERIAPGSTTDLAVGDDVFGETWGSFAEYVAVPLEDLVEKPRSLDFRVAASIPMAALTAWQTVIDTARAAPGMRILIHGASGGVGSFAAQFAQWKGAMVIATASRPSFDFLRRIGIAQIIDYETERFEEELDWKVDVVIDPIGGETQARSWRVIETGGLLVNLVGEIDREAAHAAGVRAVAFAMEYDTGDLRRIAALLDAGTIRPHVSEVFPLRRAREALDLNQQGRSHGKVVLDVA